MTDRDEYLAVTDSSAMDGEIEETILDDRPRPAPPLDLPLEADVADALDQRAEVDDDTFDEVSDMNPGS